MKPAKIGNKRLFLMTSGILLAFHSFSVAEPSVTAKVSATEMTLNGSVTLALEITEISNVGAAPNLNIPDFQVQRAGQTSSYQWINGQSSSLTTFNYLLSPMKTGTLQIPAITLSVNDKSYSTQPIQIVVQPDSPAPSQNPSGELPTKAVQVPSEGLRPMFMTSSVDNNRAYVGQQVMLKVQFLRRPDVRLMSQPRYVEPDMTGFLVEPLKQQEYMTTLNGTQYAVTELAYALFPTSDGDFTIGGGQIELAVRRQDNPFDPDSFFQNFFGRSEVARLSTKAIPIQVRALPKNKPVNFSGTVGRFKISSKIDAGEPEVGKPFNLILTVEGVGNINAIKEPFLPELRGFRRYESISTSHISKEGKFLHGSKEFKILLIPQVSGPLQIPPIGFVYFNPAQNAYLTETTREISLQVKPGTLSQTEPDIAPKNASTGDLAEGIRVMEKDIRFLKSGGIRRISAPIFLRGWFLIGAAIPVLFSLVAFAIRIQSQKKLERPTLYRSKKAYGKASKTLKKARKTMLLSDTTVFYGMIATAVTDFLADKFGVSSSGLTWEEIEQRLMDKKVESSMISQAHDIIDMAHMARFATSSFSDENRDEVLKKTEGLLLLLNKNLL